MPQSFAVQAADWLDGELFAVAELLRLPVMAGLTLTAAFVLIAAGGTLADLVRRRFGRRWLVEAAKTAMAGARAADKDAAPLDARLERIVQQSEADGLAALDRVRAVVRIGPALGLMGTLIPMGAALSGLARGDLSGMASTMVSAFTATVIGLACSVVAYALTLLRERWLRQDLLDIAYAAEQALAAGRPDAR